MNKQFTDMFGEMNTKEIAFVIIGTCFMVIGAIGLVVLILTKLIP